MNHHEQSHICNTNKTSLTINLNALPIPFATMEYLSYCCGETGHKSLQCTLKDKITRSDWVTVNYINMDQNKVEVENYTEAKTDTIPDWMDDHSIPYGKLK